MFLYLQQLKHDIVSERQNETCQHNQTQQVRKIRSKAT